MTSPKTNKNNPHLDFYLEHDISPVRQDVSDIHRHLERRGALYRRVGAHYAVQVAEQRGGLAMFKTGASSWNAAEGGPKRDVAGEIMKAVRDEGLQVVATMHHMWLWAWYPTWPGTGTDCDDAVYQLTAEHGGLYGPQVPSADEWSHPNTSVAFQARRAEHIAPCCIACRIVRPMR